MKSLIMANGEYKDPDWYRSQAKEYGWVACADGGANWARRFGITPSMVIGDMDSIKETERLNLEKGGTSFFPYPADKDFTDTYLALELARTNGIKDITLWGATGSRMDHTLANIFNAAYFVKNGMNIRFESPAATIYLVKDSLLLKGNIGDTISVLALGEKAERVTLKGFKYPLNEVTVEEDQPIGVSNVITETESSIEVASGILAVFHNHMNLD